MNRQVLTVYETALLLACCVFLGIRTPLKAGDDSGPAKPLRLAIGGFAGLDDDRTRIERSRRLTDLVTIELTTSANFDLVDRSEIDLIAKEMALALSGWNQAANSLQVGKLLRADWLLVGSFVKLGGTNCVVARVVDASTGVIRDLTVVQDDGANLPEMSRRLSEFVLNSPRTNTTLSRRIFLGVGGFEDLGVNNRYPELRKEIRLKLEEAFRGGAVAVVERAMVNSLLTELRLRLNGLAGPASDSTEAFPSFLLIDGTYQARYEGQQQIELLLRLEAIGSAPQVVKLNGRIGPELLEEIVRVVQSTLNDRAPASPQVTNRSEALVQLERGKERARLPSAMDSITLGGYVPGQDDSKRRQNIAEAIEAFQAALLIDPELTEAKLYLARCLLEPCIDQLERGRDYLREVIAGRTHADLAFKARYKLAESFENKDDAEARRLYSDMLSEAPDPAERARLLDTMYPTILRLHRQGHIKLEDGTEQLKKLLWTLCEAAEWAMTNQAGNTSARIPREVFGLTGRLQNTYTCFTHFDSLNEGSGKVRIESLLPLLCDRYPRWSPHVLVSYVIWLHWNVHVQPSSETVEHLAQSLARVARDPDKVPGLSLLQQQLLPVMASWCVTNQHPEILASVQLLRSHGQSGTTLPSAVLIPRTNPPTRSVFSASPAKEPVTFSIGEPVLTMPERTVFACDGGQIWLRDGFLPAVYDITSGTITDLDWPKEVEHYITTIAVNVKYVWFGTAGSGLLELDKQTRRWRQYTEKDGLVLSKISALYPAEHRLWVGFGHRESGGAGFLDLKTKKFTAFTPELKEMPAQRYLPAHDRSGEGQPPRNYIHGIAEGASGDVWMAVARVGLQCYQVETGVWSSTAMDWVRNDCLTSLVGNRRQMVLGGNGYNGGATVLDLESRRQQGVYQLSAAIKRKIGKPPRANRMVNALALDGTKLWVGGLNYLAQVDLKSGTVDCVAEFGKDEAVVWKVEVCANELWIAVENELYRIPRTAWLATKD